MKADNQVGGRNGAGFALTRRGLASLVAAVIVAMSFSVSFTRGAQAAQVATGVQSIMVNTKAAPGKPCQRMPWPGAAGNCPLSSFSFGALQGEEHDYSNHGIFDAASWRIEDLLLSAQKFAGGLYKPPRASA